LDRNIHLVKYSAFDKEKKRSFKKQIYRVENWEYDEQKDGFTCPQGKFLGKLYETKYKTEAGFETTRNVYGHDECPECPVLAECSRGKFRRVRSSPKLMRLKQKSQEWLRSDWGCELRKRRAHEVETVFGEIKGNQGFRRFNLGGLDGVSTEWGLHMMAYNLKKLWKRA
jgi:transposase